MPQRANGWIGKTSEWEKQTSDEWRVTWTYRQNTDRHCWRLLHWPNAPLSQLGLMSGGLKSSEKREEKREKREGGWRRRKVNASRFIDEFFKGFVQTQFRTQKTYELTNWLVSWETLVRVSSFICGSYFTIFIFCLFMAKHFGHVHKTWVFLGNFATRLGVKVERALSWRREVFVLGSP